MPRSPYSRFPFSQLRFDILSQVVNFHDLLHILPVVLRHLFCYLLPWSDIHRVVFPREGITGDNHVCRPFFFSPREPPTNVIFSCCHCLVPSFCKTQLSPIVQTHIPLPFFKPCAGGPFAPVVSLGAVGILALVALIVRLCHGDTDEVATLTTAPTWWTRAILCNAGVAFHRRRDFKWFIVPVKQRLRQRLFLAHTHLHGQPRCSHSIRAILPVSPSIARRSASAWQGQPSFLQR